MTDRQWLATVAAGAVAVLLILQALVLVLVSTVGQSVPLR